MFFTSGGLILLTRIQLDEIDCKLRSGITPEAIAESMGLSYTGFRNALLVSGRQWRTVRRLVPTGPADEPTATNAVQDMVAA